MTAATKTCKRCGRELPASEFDPTGKGGTRTRCAECRTTRLLECQRCGAEVTSLRKAVRHTRFGTRTEFVCGDCGAAG